MRTRLVRATRRALAPAGLALALLALAPSLAAAVPARDLGGATRYDTAVAISREAFPTGADSVVLAGGLAWPDALGGSALAGAVDGPVLLTPPAELASVVASEVVRLGATRVYVLGGTGSVSAAVEARLAAILPPGATVVRLGGTNRYEVAEKVAREVAAISPPARALVVTGRSFADALSCAAPAAAHGWPILLADPAYPARVASVLRSVGASDVVIAGGTGSVPPSVASALAGVVGSSHVTRIGGANRYDVCMGVAAWSEANAGLGFSAPVIASGVVPGDALAGGVLAAKRGAPVLLTEVASLPDTLAETLFARRAEVGSFAFLGGTGTMPPHVREEAQQALRARPFSIGNAMAHIRALAGFGPRGAGGSAERAAAAYLAARLTEYGYTVTTQKVTLPDGRTSQNVIAERPGTAPGVIVIGGHLDSKPPSPGGNDNASGVAVTIELARCLKDAEGLVPTIRFIGFGAEEIGGPTPNDHHFGSRQYVASLSATERQRIETMISIDMVGYGTTFNVRNLQLAGMTTVRSLQSWGTFTAQTLPFLKDFGRSGWSDHEAFEHVGIPVAWLEWRDDPVYHTAADTASHVSADRVRRSGRLVRGWLVNLTPSTLDALRP